MNGSITLGRYLPGSSFLHRLNPRFKLLVLLLFLIVLFTLKTLTGLGLLIILLLLAFITARVPLLYMVSGLRPVLYIICLLYTSRCV